MGACACGAGGPAAAVRAELSRVFWVFAGAASSSSPASSCGGWPKGLVDSRRLASCPPGWLLFIVLAAALLRIAGTCVLVGQQRLRGSCVCRRPAANQGGNCVGTLGAASSERVPSAGALGPVLFLTRLLQLGFLLPLTWTSSFFLSCLVASRAGPTEGEGGRQRGSLLHLHLCSAARRLERPSLPLLFAGTGR